MRDSLPSSFNIEAADRFSARESIRNSQPEALSTLFPLIGRVVDRLQEKRQDAERERIDRVVTEEKQITHSELLSTSIKGLALEQGKTVNLLKELLDLVKTGGIGSGRNDTPSPGGGSGLGGLAAGAGALALSALSGKAAIVGAAAAGIAMAGRALLGDDQQIQERENLQQQERDTVRRETDRARTPVTTEIPANLTPERASTYAMSMGHTRGSPEYDRIIQQARQNTPAAASAPPAATPTTAPPAATPTTAPPAATAGRPTAATTPTAISPSDDPNGPVSRRPGESTRDFNRRAREQQQALIDRPQDSDAAAVRTVERIPEEGRANLPSLNELITPPSINIRSGREFNQDLSSLEQPTDSAGMMDALLAGFDEGSTRTQAGSGTQYAQVSTDQTVMSDAMPEPTTTQEEPHTHAEPEQQPPAAQNLTFSSGVDQRINPEIASKVQQIESAFGKRLIVSSGFRDPVRNARAGGARNSAHTRGNAVDLVFSGNEEDTIKLIEKASAAGIGGIGVYRAGWVHLDTENKRVWGRDFTNRSIPQWARAALNAHMTGRRDGERQQPAAPETPSMEPNAQPASGVMAEGGGAAQDMAAAATPQQQQPQTGMQMLSESQENAVAERTPAPPTVIQSQETPAGEATQGADVGGVFQSADDPGPVEPDDAATRYARLFNMAA